ncbi:MAG: ribonuclease III [Lachnospiraceae bacterium]|nr:ribonuclease III [Lachnospiraceae bacterium]
MEAGMKTFVPVRDLLHGGRLLSEEEIRQLSPNTLAFIGDAVFELYVRLKVLNDGRKPADKLNREKAEIVNAGAQAALLKRIDARLTEEEKTIVRRGRNAKHHTTAKNQTIQDYNQATGLEALCAFLYLGGHTERLTELLAYGFSEPVLMA